MSTLGGIYNLDNSPVDKRLTMILSDALTVHGPDGGKEVYCGSISLVYRAFHTNSESRQEIQPLVSNDGNIVCWDGRLDNRDELITILRDVLCGDHTDVNIVMAAYQKWGDTFLPRIIGDFALAIWNSKKKKLLLARDIAGPRPLFYFLDRKTILWSSDLVSLLDLAAIELEINEEYIAGYLTRNLEPGLTPYKNIHAVPPGNVVTLRHGQIRVQSFWALDPLHEIRYKTDGEYEEHFRSLLREAIRCRLRVDGPVWAQLSGGLDSSSIVCMADEILNDGEAQASQLETVSYVYGQSTSSDERDFIHCVEEKRGRNGYYVREEDCPPLTPPEDESFSGFPSFLDCFAERHRALGDAMRVGKARVLLTGHGGDELLCSAANPSPQLGDQLVQCQLLQLHKSLKTWSEVLKRPYLQLLWRDGALPLLPRWIQLSCGFKSHVKLPPWFDQRFVASMNLQERNIGLPESFGFKLPSSRDQAEGLLSAIRGISKCAYRARAGVEVSHPYLHRPLVEFLQAIPFEQRLRPGETRSLMRRALRELLPEKISKRKSKRGPDEAIFKAVGREWQRLLPILLDSWICGRGYMNAEALLMALEKARHGCESHSFALIQTISLEFWLRALERRRSITRNTRLNTGTISPDKCGGPTRSFPATATDLRSREMRYFRAALS